MRLVMHLDLPAEASLLPRTRRAIAGYLEVLGGTPDEVHDVALALDEACANAIIHGSPSTAATSDLGDVLGDAERHFSLCAELTDELVVLEVEDSGRGFAVEDVVLRPEDLAAESGRGLRLIARLMSTVEVESPTPLGGTRLRMSKQLGPSGLN